MKKALMVAAAASFFGLCAVYFYRNSSFESAPNADHIFENGNDLEGKDEQENEKNSEKNIAKQQPPEQKGTFFEDFSRQETIREVGSPAQSKSADWWVNSGAYLIKEDGFGRTVFGGLKQGSEWQKKYQEHNSKETDGGTHPQNIFRLLTKSKWQNFSQEAYFNIHRYHLSEDKHRSESNGALLFSRYQDSDNLYYAGIRVDGNAVIKKKKNGKYFTMDIKKVFAGEHDRKENPNLLPKDKWMGVKTEVKNMPEGKVQIKLFVDKQQTGEWELVLEVLDDGKTFGGPAIIKEGSGGIRTDFMDVKFDDFEAKKIEMQ